MTDIDVVYIARGSTHDERQRSIDTIKHYLRGINSRHDPGILQELYDCTEQYASTVSSTTDNADTDAYLYVHPYGDTATDRQGPDNPPVAAMKRAAGGDTPSNVIVDTLAAAPTDSIEAAVTKFRVRVHDATHHITLNPTRHERDELPVATRRALEVLTGVAEHADSLLAGIEWSGGRPPVGCTSNDGRLAPDDDYDDVCRVLQRVEDDDLSKSKAAGILSCARKTIDNALERPELYRIE